MEEARTNIIDRNTSNYNSIWSNQTPPGAFNNAGIAPDGTNTAFATTSYQGVARGQKNYAVAADTNDYTFSIFIKSTGGQGQYVSFKTGFHNGHNDDNNQIVYDFATDTVGHGYSRKLYANGWVRISKTYTNSSLTTFVVSNNNSTSLDMLFWGAQVEQGSYPSSLIITSTSFNVTRAADLSTSALGVDSFYNESEGTFFGKVTGPTGFGFVAHDGSNNNRHGFGPVQGTTFTVISGLPTDFGVTPTPVKGGGKFAHAYKANDYGAFGNGVNLPATSPTTVPPGVNELAFGYRGRFQSNAFLNGHIKRLTYFNTRLSDDKLKSITT